MKLSLIRHSHGKDSTGGLLFIDGEFFCYTLEDEERETKIYGETCIPLGSYQIKLRNEGGMNKKYSVKYPNHQGMLWLQNVPGFEWIYIHVGNTDDDTSGCILVGMSATFRNGDHTIGMSTVAYTLLYAKVLKSMANGEDVTISIS